MLLLALIANAPLVSQAARRVTVAQLKRTLTADIAVHKGAADIARQIGTMQLTERLTNITLDRLGAPFIGSPVAAALQLLADQSAFLSPPASELPATAAPNNATRERILEAARQYILHTLPGLPDFLAMRTTLHYDNSPYPIREGQWPVRAGLHLVDRSSREISVRDERENRLPAQGAAFWRQNSGLISGGEFGATLGMILVDTSKGAIIWSHWEQTAAGLTAVYDYSVPRSASHFAVLTSLSPQPAIGVFDTPGGGARGTLGIGARPMAGSSDDSIHRTEAAYHGSLSIDPATGTVLRITIEAELKSGSLLRAAIMVQYGPIKVGNSTFICPMRSVALSKAFTDPQTIAGDAATAWLNKTFFTNYHRFGSTVRILPETGTLH